TRLRLRIQSALRPAMGFRRSAARDRPQTIRSHYHCQHRFRRDGIYGCRHGSGVSCRFRALPIKSVNLSEKNCFQPNRIPSIGMQRLVFIRQVNSALGNYLSDRSCLKIRFRPRLALLTYVEALFMPRLQTTEDRRLEENRTRKGYWKRWGPYLSERQWGTVREDYSPGGTAWEFFPHDHARSRAYRWGEDGIAGISDRHQMICFALALWNGHDPILKERLFGLTGNEGNHGEDVKEYYFYLDSTPTHSYMRMLYKYPQAEFPYGWLVEENRRRGRSQPEFELLDTGVF